MITSGSGAPRAVGSLALLVVRATMKDRVSLFFFLLLPVLVMTLVGTALAKDEGQKFVIVDLDRSWQSELVVDRLVANEVLVVTKVRDEASARSAVREQRASAGLVIPSGFGAAVAQGAPADARFLALRADAVPAAVRLAVAEDVSSVGALLRSATAVGAATGETALEVLPRATAEQAATSLQLTEADTAGSGRPLSGVAYTAPANLVLFMLVNVLGTSRGLAGSRRSGATRRTMVMPHRPWVVTAGEGLGRLVLALAQAALLVLVSSTLFNVSWGPWPALLALVIVFGVFCASASLLLASVARSESQAFALAPPIGIAAGMLGGSMWPLAIVGDTLRSVGHLLPTAWTLDAALDLAAGPFQPARFAAQLAVVAGFAAVAAVAAAHAFTSSLKRSTL